jgi:hypothetical protein
MTNQDIATGETALIAWLKKTLGFKSMFIPEQTEKDGTILIIKAMDATEGDEAAKAHAAAGSLYQSISDAGYGSQVTTTQCAACAVVVVDAVIRGRNSGGHH